MGEASDGKDGALPFPEKLQEADDLKATPREARNQSAKKTRTRSEDSRSVPDEGAELERRVARVEFAEGALARTRVPVMADVEAGRDVLTDIDVLAVDVDQRLRLSSGIFECKSGAGQSGEPDRLLWLSGFQRYLGAEMATLVRRTTSRRGKLVAARLNVRLVDDAALNALEVTHGWLPDSFAHVGGENCAAAEARTTTQLKGLRSIPTGLVSFLRNESWFVESWNVLTALVALDWSVQEQGVLPTPAGPTIASHALMGLFIAAIRDAGRLDFVPSTTLRNQLSLALTVGSPEDTHVLDVLADSDRVVQALVEDLHRTYQKSGVSRVEFEVPSLSETVAAEPTNALDHYVDLVERLRGNSTVSREMLQCVELCCFEALMGGDAYKAAAFDHLFTPEHHQLLTIGITALGAISGEAVAQHVKPIIDGVAFDRSAPTLPDRRQRPN